MTTDAELLKMAVEFDVGPPPLVNGKLWTPEWRDAYHHNVRIVQRLNARTGETKWAIHHQSSDLNKSGHWEYARSGSSTRADYLRRCRYDTVQEALEHWKNWRAAVVTWAEKKILQKGPQVVLNLPSKLKF